MVSDYRARRNYGARKVGDGRLGHEPMVTVGVSVEPATRARLEKIALEKDETLSSLVRAIVLEALSRLELPATEITQENASSVA